MEVKQKKVLPIPKKNRCDIIRVEVGEFRTSIYRL